MLVVYHGASDLATEHDRAFLYWPVHGPLRESVLDKSSLSYDMMRVVHVTKLHIADDIIMQ